MPPGIERDEGGSVVKDGTVPSPEGDHPVNVYRFAPPPTPYVNDNAEATVALKQTGVDATPAIVGFAFTVTIVETDPQVAV